MQLYRSVELVFEVTYFKIIIILTKAEHSTTADGNDKGV